MAVHEIDAQEFISLARNDRDGLDLIDVRDKSESLIIRLKGSKLITLHSLASRLDEVDWSKKAVFYCRSGARSLWAAQMADEAKDAYNLTGGIRAVYQSGADDLLDMDPDKLGRYF